MVQKPKYYSFSYSKTVRDENGNDKTVSYQNGYIMQVLGVFFKANFNCNIFFL